MSMKRFRIVAIACGTLLLATSSFAGHDSAGDGHDRQPVDDPTALGVPDGRRTTGSDGNAIQSGNSEYVQLRDDYSGRSPVNANGSSTPQPNSGASSLDAQRVSTPSKLGDVHAQQILGALHAGWIGPARDITGQVSNAAAFASYRDGAFYAARPYVRDSAGNYQAAGEQKVLPTYDHFRDTLAREIEKLRTNFREHGGTPEQLETLKTDAELVRYWDPNNIQQIEKDFQTIFKR